MKRHLKNAGKILLGGAALIVSIALVTVTVKICWTLIKLVWNFW
jgi:hypothetical protein